MEWETARKEANKDSMNLLGGNDAEYDKQLKEMEEKVRKEAEAKEREIAEAKKKLDEERKAQAEELAR